MGACIRLVVDFLQSASTRSRRCTTDQQTLLLSFLKQHAASRLNAPFSGSPSFAQMIQDFSLLLLPTKSICVLEQRCESTHCHSLTTTKIHYVNEARCISQEQQVLFLETSAKTGQNVASLFATVADALVNRTEINSRNQVTK